MINPITGRKFLPFTDNKKTYGLVAAIIVEGVLQAFGWHVPTWLEMITFGGAVAAHRASISNISSTIDDLKNLITYQAVTTSSVCTPLPSITTTDSYRNSTEEEKTALLNKEQIGEHN